jgi:hypothetical protein
MIGSVIILCICVFSFASFERFSAACPFVSETVDLLNACRGGFVPCYQAVIKQSSY